MLRPRLELGSFATPGWKANILPLNHLSLVGIDCWLLLLNSGALLN